MSLSAQVVFFFLLLVILWVCNLLSSMGAKKCPAALSSTVMTGVQMASGYLVDILCALQKRSRLVETLNPAVDCSHCLEHEFYVPVQAPRRLPHHRGFHKLPKALTAIGACMMLLAVLTMALTRLPGKIEVPRRYQQLATSSDRQLPRRPTSRRRTPTRA